MMIEDDRALPEKRGQAARTEVVTPEPARSERLEHGLDGICLHVPSDPADGCCAWISGHVVDRWSGPGDRAGEIDWGHDVASDADGNVYVVDIRGGRVQKFRRVTDTPLGK